MTEPSDVVQQQVEAYNGRDAPAFAAFYAPEAIVFGPDGQAMVSGQAEIEALYARMFDQSPELHVEIPHRMAVGNWVVDEEQAAGIGLEGMPSEMSALVAYQVVDGLIVQARLMT